MIRESYIEWWKTYTKCWKCWEFKEATNEFFWKAKDWFMWLRRWCKDCDRIYFREYRRQHKDRINELAKKYTASPRRKESSKIWAMENREKVRESWRKYRARNKDKIREALRLKEKTIFNKVHTKTRRFISKFNIRPDRCMVCGSTWYIYAHHTNYEKRYEVAFVCPSCHNLIHNWTLECPKPINILQNVSQARG